VSLRETETGSDAGADLRGVAVDGLLAADDEVHVASLRIAPPAPRWCQGIGAGKRRGQ